MSIQHFPKWLQEQQLQCEAMLDKFNQLLAYQKFGVDITVKS
jgi:hypothetical protein